MDRQKRKWAARIGCFSLLICAALHFTKTPPASADDEERSKSGVAQRAVSSSDVEATPADRTIHETKLANGLTVLSIPDHGLPLVTIEVAVKNGSFTEPPELNGLSHLYEHMFFKGNKKIPDAETYLRKAGRLGMVMNAATGEESVSYYFSLHRDNLEKGLEFMRDSLLHPLFDERELEKEKVVIEAEYDQAEASPHFHLQRGVDRGLWGKNWSRRNPLGSRDVIRKANREQLEMIRQQYYQPSNTALIIAGDVTSEKAVDLAKKYFGGWEGRKVRLPEVKDVPLRDHVVRFVHKPVASAAVMIGFQGPSLKDDGEAVYAADVFSFGINAKTSSFQKAMVRSGLTFRASLFYLTRRAQGPIYLIFTVEPANVVSALKEAMKQIQSWDDPSILTDAQIEGAKVRLEVDDVYSREKTSQFANLVGRWWASAGLEHYRSYIKNVRKTTREDMSRFAGRYIKGRPMSVGVLISEKSAKDAGLTPEKIKSVLPLLEGDGGGK